MMTSVSNYTNSIFQQSWWLEAVAPGRWSIATVEERGVTKARMPYVVSRKYGLRCIVQPKLTQTLGPWLAPTDEKPSHRLKHEKEWLTRLVDELPPFDIFQQSWHYSVGNWLPFFWRGFDCASRYTMVLDDLTDPDQLWHGYHDTTQRQIKKARRLVEVCDDLGLDQFWKLNVETFRRQGRSMPYSRELIDSVDAACAAHDARKVFFAKDTSGRVHAALYLVWDEHSAYYLMSGSDSELRSSGSLSLLMHEAIQFAATVSGRFDFEGSMHEPIERFFRNFGATPKQYFQVRGYSRRASVLQGLRDMFRKAAA
jgi:hypothetical protein